MAFPLIAAVGAVALRFAPNLLRVTPRVATALRKPATTVGPGVLKGARNVPRALPPVRSSVGFKKQALIFGGSTVAGGALGGYLSGKGPAAGVQGVLSPITHLLGNVAGFTWDALPPVVKGAVLVTGGVGGLAGYRAIRGKLEDRKR